MLFREYRSADFPRLCKIDRLCFESRVAYSAREMRDILRAPGVTTVVVENRLRRITAFAVMERDGRSGRVITLDVLPRYRRRGIGRELMLLCERRLWEAGARTMRLETADSNRRAHALYRSLGYTATRRIERYYANGEDAWVMEKELVRP